MELIQALERLSLEVRNQKIGNSKQHDSDVRLVDYSMTPELNDEADHDQQSESRARCPSASSQRQLDEFDNSIKTLLSQISDLDYLHTATQTNQYSSDSTRRGSLETSSEEYSDESSCNEIISRENPIVDYLLTCDLVSITNIVKKISRILAIGSEIEALYQILSCIHSNLDASSHIDSLYTRSICDEFSVLLDSEPKITSLPTILHYNDIRLKLLSRLNQPNGDCAMDQSDNDESDIANLDAEQKNLDEWTNNKLYIKSLPR